LTNSHTGQGWDREIAAVCCHFNPCHYQSRLANYWRFQQGITASSLRLLTVECAFGSDAFELPSGPNVLQVRGRDIMWQKERLLQIGAQHLIDEGYSAVIFLDADVIFHDPGWPTAVLRSLMAKPVIQCFSNVRFCFNDQIWISKSGARE